MQTFARQLTLQSGRTCRVDLAVEDALGVGHSLRTLVRSGRIPAGCADVYERVAKQILASARLAVVEGQ
jgi:hypothetical protein